MAQRCDICRKKRIIGHNVSYSKRRTYRVFIPNLRWANILIDGKVQKVKTCMKCLKKAKKENRVISGKRQVVRENKEDVKNLKAVASPDVALQDKKTEEVKTAPKKRKTTKKAIK
ncbi:MAG: 50S ribosomal protein L28 [Candidatus Gottesmanbacteria bacterium]